MVSSRLIYVFGVARATILGHLVIILVRSALYLRKVLPEEVIMFDLDMCFQGRFSPIDMKEKDKKYEISQDYYKTYLFKKGSDNNWII